MIIAYSACVMCSLIYPAYKVHAPYCHMWPAPIYNNFPHYPINGGDRGGTVVKVLCYKSEGRWLDPRWCHWNFSLT